jgi:hypothetical protein
MNERETWRFARRRVPAKLRTDLKKGLILQGMVSRPLGPVPSRIFTSACRPIY